MARHRQGGAEGAGSSLEVATKLARPIRAEWVLTLYPTAGEAAGTFQALSRPRRCPTPGPALDPERAATEAARRARTMVRRYVAANRLDRLGTLTYRGEGCHDERALRRNVRHFFKRLRVDLDIGAFAYLWVPEWHKTAHGLHAHFAIGMYVPQKRIEDAWGRGFVHIKRLGRGARGGSLEAARRSAGYLSKYVAKAFDTAREHRLHRYDRAQGFSPAHERIAGSSRSDVIEQASDRMGGPPSRVWDSRDERTWAGPLAVWAGWDE
jgi:hypothetical protein